MLSDMNVDDLQRALGGIVLESAYLERVLRASLSALIGSKYTAVIDGRMMAHTLIEDCRHVAKVHTVIPEPAKNSLTQALNACDAVNKKRNRVIHEAWTYRPRDVMVTLQGHRNPQDVTDATRTLDELHDLIQQISDAAGNLVAAVTGALGADSMRIEDRLRAELGHDVRADVGY